MPELLNKTNYAVNPDSYQLQKALKNLLIS